MPRVYVTRQIAEESIALLRERLGADAVEVFGKDRAMSREELLAILPGLEGLLCLPSESIDAEVLDTAGPQLRIVANCAVGFNNIDLEAATARRVAATNTPGVLDEATADLTWALILAAARRLGEAERFLRAGKWQGFSPGQLLGVPVHGATLGIFGMGRIGKAVARRAPGFGMRLLYHNRSRLPREEEEALQATYVDKPALLAESDILSLHCPLTDETVCAFGAAEFRAMKRDAVFVNTTRGPVVDEAALAEALEQGEIFAAGLDVFEHEPQVHEALLKCERAVLLPHIGSANAPTRTRMAVMAAENILAALEGRLPPQCLNPEAWQ